MQVLMGPTATWGRMSEEYCSFFLQINHVDLDEEVVVFVFSGELGGEGVAEVAEARGGGLQGTAHPLHPQHPLAHLVHTVKKQKNKHSYCFSKNYHKLKMVVKISYIEFFSHKIDLIIKINNKKKYHLVPEEGP